MINELGLNNADNLALAHIKAVKPVDTSRIVSKNTSFLKNKFNLGVTETIKTYQYILDSYTFHKNSTKARFIVTTSKCSVKQFPKYSCLKANIQPIKHYNFKT